jgi:predicted alpha/beta hydrolase family esterase
MDFTNGCYVMDREASADPAILIVPGWSGSGPSHWQTIWEREHPEYRRVEQRNWQNVYRPEWVAGLERAVLSVSGDVVLVAHSFASCLAATSLSAVCRSGSFAISFS